MNVIERAHELNPGPYSKHQGECEKEEHLPVSVASGASEMAGHNLEPIASIIWVPLLLSKNNLLNLSYKNYSYNEDLLRTSRNNS